VKTLWPSFAPDDGVFFGPLPALKAAMKVVVEGAKEAGIDIFSNAIFWCFPPSQVPRVSKS